MAGKRDMTDSDWMDEEGNFSAVKRGGFKMDSFKWFPVILAILSEMLEIKENKKFRVTIVCDPEAEQIRWEREETT